MTEQLRIEELLARIDGLEAEKKFVQEQGLKFYRSHVERLQYFKRELESDSVTKQDVAFQINVYLSGLKAMEQVFRGTEAN